MKMWMQFKVMAGRTADNIVMFTVNRLTENCRLTGLSINRTETDNMAAAQLYS